MNKKFLSLLVLIIFSISLISQSYIPSAQASPTQFTTTQINGHYYQRHTWYANGRSWVLCSDGVNTVYQSSLDGITWTSPTTFCTGNAFTQRCNVALSSNGLDVSIISVNNPNGFFYRMGTCNSDGTITWHGVGYTYNIDATEVCITLDSLNYPYILYNRSPESAWFSQRSTTNDGTFTLGAEGVQYVGSIAGGDVEGNTMPLPAQEMYSIYTLQHTSGILYGTLENLATHMWGAPEAITATSVAAYRFSMVSDGTVIYLSYCDLTTGHAYLYIRNSIGVWTNLGDISNEAILDTPSVIRDTTYGGAWIFWANAATNIKAIHVSPTGILGTARIIKYEGIPVTETGIIGLEIQAITSQTNHVGIIYPTATGTSFDKLSIYSDFIISNMMGSDVYGNGLKVIKTEETFYSFELSISGVSTDPVSYASVRFYNNGNLIQVDYNSTTGLTKVVSGNDFILLHETQIFTTTDTLIVKWQIWLKSTCVDKQNMDIQTYFSTTSGLNVGWDTYSQYCSLYNLGGWVSSTSTGTSTATTTCTTVITTTITQSSTTFYTTSLTTSPNTITTTSQTSTTSPVATTTLTTSTVITSSTNPGVTTETTTTPTTSTVITTTTTSSTYPITTSSLTSITTSTTVYSSTTTSSTVITTTKATQTIVNGAAGNIVGGDKLDLFANANSLAKAQIAFHNLQNVNALIKINTNIAIAWDSDKYAWQTYAYIDDVTPIKIGLDYWSGTTYCNGMYVVLEPVEGHMSSSLFIITFKASWYFNNVLIKTDYIDTYPLTIQAYTSSWWEVFTQIFADLGLSRLSNYDYTASSTFVIDYWFNKMNSSSVMGGRITSEYYGVSNDAPWYLSWATGNQFGKAGTNPTVTTLFHNIVDSTGAIIPASNVDMSYFWTSVQQDNNNNGYKLSIGNYNVLDFGIVKGRMIGINTPAYIETKMPTMAQTGFLNALWAGIQQTFQGLFAILASTFGLLGDAAYKFIDSILAYFGLSGVFETIIKIITDLWVNISLLIVDSVLFITSTLSIIVSFFSFSMTWVIATATILVQLINLVVGILQGTSSAVTGLGDIWTKLNLTVALPLIIVVVLVQWLLSLDERTKKYGAIAWLKLAISEAQIFVGVFMGIAQFVINLFVEVILKIIFYIREMLPKIAGTG